MSGYLSHFDEAHMGISVNRLRTCIQAGDSLIELLVLLCLSGKLGLEHYEMSRCLKGGFAPNLAHRAICLDVENSCVFLPKRPIVRVCDRFGIPRPDFFRAEKDLAARGLTRPNTIEDGLLVSSGVWEEAVKGCRSELNQSL
jgi:hypothetical protein